MKETRKRKLLAVLISLAMILPLASCSDSTENADTSSSSEEKENTSSESGELETELEETKLKPNIPESADFGGDEVTFLYWTHTPWLNTIRESRDIVSEGLTGEGINDAVFNRNVMIEDAYKVKIKLEKMDRAAIAGEVQKNVNSGDATYDVIVPRMGDASTLITKSLIHSFTEIPNIDLEQPWWDQNFKESLMILGKLPLMSGSILINDKDATAAVAFNKTIASNYNLEDPYTIVREGNWTYDKAAELADAADQDTNGDGKLSEDDIYGFLGGRDVMESFYYGSGEQHVAITEEGFEFRFGSTERTIDAAQAVIDFMNQPWFMNHHLISNQDDAYYRQLFETGHGLFFWMRLDDVTSMRAGEADFGILPTPKYEASQKKYYNMVSRHTGGILALPISNSGENLDMTGMILEAMTAESHYTLIPEYIETSLKTKNSRDAESADMLDIIINNRVLDPMNLYNLGGFADTFLYYGDKADTNLASSLKSTQKMIAKQIERFIESLDNSEE